MESIKYDNINSKNDKSYKPYFVLRYGYLQDKIQQNTIGYESNSGHSDSLQIFTDETDGIYSEVKNIHFALVQNHLLPNKQLPKNYQQSEVAIITHEVVHVFIEIVIDQHFNNLSKSRTEKSFTALGEGLALAFQCTFLDIRTHYADHEYTPYLLLGKAYFTEFKRVLGELESENLKNLVSLYSANVKEKYLEMRTKLINGESTKNELITKFDFSFLASHFKNIDLKMVVSNAEIEYDLIKSKLSLCFPIENPSSIHLPDGSGYINYYLIEADNKQNLNRKNTILYLNMYKNLLKLIIN